MSAEEYSRADNALRVLDEVRRALCAADNAMDELGAHADDAGLIRSAREALGYTALDRVDTLIRRETARRDAAEHPAGQGACDPEEACCSSCALAYGRMDGEPVEDITAPEGVTREP